MMPPVNLLELVERLRKRIEAHRDKLPRSETLTRYVLIDTILRELGWDTGDPEAVRPEYNTGDRSRADYALMVNGKPFIMLEAKSLGSSLDGAAVQGINYCQLKGTPYFAVTDGSRWKVYETHRMAPLAEKLVVEFDITEMSSAEVCLKALALWRPAAETGALAAGNEPLVNTTKGAEVVTPPKHDPDPVLPDNGWLSLQEWSTAREPGRGPRLTEMRFPDGQIAEIKRWRDLVTQAVEWLVKTNHPLEKHLPIPAGASGTGKTYLVADEPFHGTGRPMEEPLAVGQYYVDRFNCTPDATAKFMRTVQRVGLDPSKFKLRFK